MAPEHAFEIDSNVGRYWLANGEGFDVVVEPGRRLGVVEDVVFNPLTHEVSSVVVRRTLATPRLHRRARVPIGDLSAVVPAARRFVMVRARRPSARPRRRPHVRRKIVNEWPAVRDALAVAAVRIGDALGACVAVSAALVDQEWNAARTRLRGRGLGVRTRAKRARLLFLLLARRGR